MSNNEQNSPVTPPNPYLHLMLGHRALGEPLGLAGFKQCAEDFIVEEQLPITFTGDGEHFYLQIEKVQQNTRWVAKQIARSLSISNRLVSYAGLKDRQSISRQWFSVHLPGKGEPNWSDLEGIEGVQLLKVEKHNKKLKIGMLSRNRFHIVLRDFEADKEQVQERLNIIKQSGVPNYFGHQRFGWNGANLLEARRFFQDDNIKIDRDERSLYISAARSFLFNIILSQRIQAGNWQQCLEGDAMMFDEGNSYFVVSEDEVEVTHQRILQQGLSPSGALWGQGLLDTTSSVAEIERKVAQDFIEFAQGLESLGLSQQRRRLICHISDLHSEWLAEDKLALNFSLSSGCYATSVLRELCDINPS